VGSPPPPPPAVAQLAVHGSPAVPLFGPSSHASPLSTTPLPHEPDDGDASTTSGTCWRMKSAVWLGRVSAPHATQLSSPNEVAPITLPLGSNVGPPESPLHWPLLSLWSKQIMFAFDSWYCAQSTTVRF